MPTLSRREIRYDQFVKRRPKRWPWLVLGLAGLVAVGAGASFLHSSQALAHHAPPPALSSAGAPVADESYEWSHVAIGGGGFITGLGFDASGSTMVARTDVYGAYVWSPQADRWVQLMTAPSMPAFDRVQGTQASGVYEIAVAPSRPERIFMAAKGHVYRSDDRGAHWTTGSTVFPEVWDANSPFRMNGPFLSVSPTNADLVFLGTANGLWRSTSGGTSWERVTSVPASEDRDPGTPGVQAPGTQIWFEKGEGGKPSGRIFALSSGHGMFVSEDGGAGFHTLPSFGAQPMTLRRGVFDRHGAFLGVDEVGKGVWLYREGRWHDLTHEAGLPMQPWTAAASNPFSDQLVIFDQSGDGYQSTDGGRNWNHVAHQASVGAGDPPWLKVSNASYFSTSDVQFDPK
ncbi:WD40/YVTN/BNR-like repeat-containing protein, partial [Novosphingobium rosa]|uniref:WD40/YVTN/BNR-like repeat-containing protein n=1 Tax=Novosphingobium rosa TaxID=76978 RepID=UPI000A4A6884